MKAMILAAGLGTRLLPYTLQRPKPLFPILNRELLLLAINRIKLAGATEIIVNAHHLRDQIKNAVQHDKGIVLQEEETVLGTGGGLRLALPHFGREPVLVVNGDIYHTIDYHEVYRGHIESRADVSLVLHDYPRYNNIVMNETLGITGFSSSGAMDDKPAGALAFTGIHVINPAVLQTIPQDSPCSIIDCYRDFLRQGGSIRAHLATGHFWTDMGTPADYLQLHAELLMRKVPVYQDLEKHVAEFPFVGLHEAAIGADAKMLDWVCIGRGAKIGAGSLLQRTVVWDGADVPPGAIIKDAIITA